MHSNNLGRSIKRGFEGVTLNGDSCRHRQGDILAGVKANHAPQEPGSWIIRTLAANCAGLATFDRSTELLQVRGFKSAATIAAGALNLGAIVAPVRNLPESPTAGAVKNGSGHDQKRKNEPPVGGVNNQ